MRTSKKRLIAVGLTVATLTGVLVSTVALRVSASNAAASGTPQTTQNLTALGTTSLGGINLASEINIDKSNTKETPQLPAEHDRGTATTSPASVPTTNPNPAPQSIASQNPGAGGFSGLNHFQQRYVASASSPKYKGTQLSLEPPDQGLCVGQGFVVEAVNNALAVYSPSGALLSGPTALSEFFGQTPEIGANRTGYGEFISDPKCLYDAASRHWFMTELAFARDSATGAFQGPSAHLIAVSKTSDPTGAWGLFKYDTTDPNANGAPCPCFGDQPLIGADAYGFYISANEFPINGPGFFGTQLYAISKSGLIAAATSGATAPTIVHVNVGGLPTPDVGGIWYSVQPATSPSTNNHENNDEENQNGTEYFLSALQFGPASLDNRIAVWSLTNTRSLNSSTPHVTLRNSVISSETYGGLTGSGGVTPDARQKAGPTPLKDAFGLTSDPLELLSSNGDLMNQVVYANGLLWSGLNTVVGSGSNQHAGIAYFVVRPQVGNDDDRGFSARMQKQGYVSLANADVIFPSIGVNAEGKGAISFTLSGPNNYPSSAYALIDADHGAGAVHIAASGVGPDDGFTGYPELSGLGTNSGRWGDYSAAVAAPDGTIWFANEYINQSCTVDVFVNDTTCGGTRTLLANWATFVGHVNPNQDDNQGDNQGNNQGN